MTQWQELDGHTAAMEIPGAGVVIRSTLNTNIALCFVPGARVKPSALGSRDQNLVVREDRPQPPSKTFTPPTAAEVARSQETDLDD